MTKEVFQQVFTAVGGGKGIHDIVCDTGQAQRVVKVKSVSVASRVREDCTKELRNNKERTFNGRWTGKSPSIRVSQNTRAGTRNIK